MKVPLPLYTVAGVLVVLAVTALAIHFGPALAARIVIYIATALLFAGLLLKIFGR